VTIIKSAKKTGAVVTVEEHQINGGLGSAVAELLGEHHPVPLKRVGVKDRFGESGTPEQLLDHFGLTYKHIMAAAQEVHEVK
jgi:transketolase